MPQIDVILQNVVKHGNDIVEQYKNSPAGYPDPSFVLQLNDEVYSGSNLHAVQKIFDGPFQFDILFESASAKQPISCQFHFGALSFRDLLRIFE